MTAIRCILLACAISFSGTVFAAAPEAKNERVEQTMYMSETTQFELNLPAEKAVYLFSAVLCQQLSGKARLYCSRV